MKRWCGGYVVLIFGKVGAICSASTQRHVFVKYAAVKGSISPSTTFSTLSDAAPGKNSGDSQQARGDNTAPQR